MPGSLLKEFRRMRYKPAIKVRIRGFTPQRLRAAERAVRRDKDSVALFPDLARHNTAQERVEQIDADNAAMVQRWRDIEAQTWKRSRRLLRSLPELLRATITAKWQAGWLPGSASYLADLIHCEVRQEALRTQPADLRKTP